ncbi:hypothetical protein PAXRUDRAFT_85917, partial [Paxillus rubicundulus Ve08.2h10]
PLQTSTSMHLPTFIQSKPLLLSVSTLKQAQHDITKKTWARSWVKSPRYPHSHHINVKMLAGSF